MNRFIEPPLAPSLGTLAIARILLDVRNHPRIEDRLAIRLGIEPTIEIEIRTFQHQPCALGHTLQFLQTFRQQDRIGFIDRRHREGNQHIAVVVDDGDDFLALLVLVAGIANELVASF